LKGSVREPRAHRRKRRLMMRFGVERLDGTAFSMDVSEAGAFMRTNSVLRPGTTLQVEIVFPERTIRLWAKVVWAKRVPVSLAHVLPCGMGVRFIDPGEDWKSFYRSWAGTEAVTTP
jgi:hypothetical protein